MTTLKAALKLHGSVYTLMEHYVDTLQTDKSFDLQDVKELIALKHLLSAELMAVHIRISERNPNLEEREMDGEVYPNIDDTRAIWLPVYGRMVDDLISWHQSKM